MKLPACLYRVDHYLFSQTARIETSWWSCVWPFYEFQFNRICNVSPYLLEGEINELNWPSWPVTSYTLREIIVNEWCFSPRGMYVCIARQEFPYRSIETRFRTDRTSQTTSQMIGWLVLSHDLYPPNLFLDQSNACLLHIMSYSIPFETVRISVWRKLLVKWTIFWFLLKQSLQDMENV